jgi:flavin reductase (DIM6/NTAB) family NADH-FMN oxidoreductase RutF
MSEMAATEPGPHPLSWLWTPLVVVTAAVDGARSGQVAVTAHGASIVPAHPRITVSLWKGNFTRELVEQSGRFAVHLLRDDQDELVYHFGLRSGREVDKFTGVEHTTGEHGAPLLRDCLAIFECRVVQRMDGGDYTLFLADVERTHRLSDGSPLWWRDLRGRMPEQRRLAWERKSALDSQAAALRMNDLPG